MAEAKVYSLRHSDDVLPDRFVSGSPQIRAFHSTKLVDAGRAGGVNLGVLRDGIHTRGRAFEVGADHEGTRRDGVHSPPWRSAPSRKKQGE